MSTNVATQNKSNTAGMSKVRFITQVGMLGAIAVILMAFEIPLMCTYCCRNLCCAFILPAAWIYKAKHSRKSAMIGMAAGTVFMAFIGCFLNAYVLLPAYAKAFSMPIDALVGMGTAVNGHITNLLTFVVFAVAPFNLLKGAMVSVVVLLIYKKISPILKMR